MELHNRRRADHDSSGLRWAYSMLRIFAVTACILSGLGALASTAVTPFRTPRATFTDSNGVPLVGGCIFTYAGGTTTPQATYADSMGLTLNANPVVLDATGSATIWLAGLTYKFVAWSAGGTNCASGAQQWTVDNVPGNTFTGEISGGTLTNVTISGGSASGMGIVTGTVTSSTVDSTPVGQTTPSSGAFTTLSGAVNAMAFSATPTFTAGSYSIFTMTLAGNVSASTITGGRIGQEIAFEFCQNGIGGFTLAWPSTFVNAPVLPTTASTCISPSFFYDGAYWQNLNYLGVAGPPAVAAGIGLGTGGTATLQAGSNNMAGAVVLTTGASPPTGAWFTMTWGSAVASTLFCTFTPQNYYSGTAALSGWYGGISSGTATFTVNSGSTALDASSELILNYVCAL